MEHIAFRQGTPLPPVVVQPPPPPALTITCDWEEFTTPEGKKYWHNSSLTVSVWEEPAEHVAYRAALRRKDKKEGKIVDPVVPPPAALSATTLGGEKKGPVEDVDDVEDEMYSDDSESERDSDEEDEEQERPYKKVKTNHPLAVTYTTREDQYKAFNDLLKAKNITHDMKWPDIAKKIEGDPRYRALETEGERRQACTEYLVNKKKTDKEEQVHPPIVKTIFFLSHFFSLLTVSPFS